MANIAKRFVTAAERIREHPLLAGLRFGVMWSLIPTTIAMVPLFFFFSSESDISLRLMDVYLASLGVMGPSSAILIAYFYSKFSGVRSFAGPAALAVYLSLLPNWPLNGRMLINVLRDTFTSGPFVGFFLAVTLGGTVIYLRKKWPRITFGAEAAALFLGFLMIGFLRYHHIEIHEMIRVMIGRHISTADTLVSALIVVGLINGLWFCGLQGSAIIGSFITAVYAQLAFDNMQAVTTGHSPHHLVNLTMINYAFIGGAGATCILPLLMIRSKSKRLRILGGASLLPVFFNVNESLIYLMPLVFNTYLVIPFLVSPLFVVASSYYAMSMGWVPKFVYYIPGIFYLPSPILAIVGTTPGVFLPHSIEQLRVLLHKVEMSGSWRTGVLSIVQIIIISLFYWPFYRTYDKEVVSEEIAEKLENAELRAAEGLV